MANKQADLIGTKAHDMAWSGEAFLRRPDSLRCPGSPRLTYCLLPDDTQLNSRVPRPKATTDKVYKRSSSFSALILPSFLPRGVSTSLFHLSHLGQLTPCSLTTISRGPTPHPKTRRPDYSQGRGGRKTSRPWPEGKSSTSFAMELFTSTTR